MTFLFKRFEGSDDYSHFYSGFQNASSYREFMTFVLCHAENISYWSRNLLNFKFILKLLKYLFAFLSRNMALLGL